MQEFQDCRSRIESTGNKTITLNTSDIKVSGLETGMSYSFEDRTFSIDVEGHELGFCCIRCICYNDDSRFAHTTSGRNTKHYVFS